MLGSRPRIGSATMNVALTMLLVTGVVEVASAQFPHPFQLVEKVDEQALKTAVAKVMAMEDSQIVRLISENAPIHLVGCPSCGGGAQDTSANVWSIDDPEAITCSYCRLTFPNEKYPLNGEVRVVNPRGQIQIYRYYDGGGEKRRYFFEGVAQERAKQYLAARARDLARLYWATKEEKYAHKAALILDRFAQVYPGWPVNGLIGSFANWKKFYTSPPYPAESGKWGRWIHDELPTELALAYDLIYHSSAFAELGKRYGTDVRKRVEQGLLRASVELVRLYPRYVGPSGMNGTAAGMIAIGRAIGEPDYVHDGVGRFKDAFTEWFFPDGMLSSGSTGYLLQMLNALPYPVKMARSYSDPPGYLHPRDGQGFQDLELEKADPMFGRAWDTARSLLLPDGRYTPVHDAWSYSRFSQDRPRQSSAPVLLPAYGHAVLGRGSGEHQVQAHLHFGYHAGHAHADQLNLLLFARGKEMLSDIGYTHTKLRPWATSTLSHNTVVVDRKNQRMTQGWIPASWTHLDRYETEQRTHNPEPVFGNLLLYDVAHDHVQVVEAEGGRGYVGQVPDMKEYRRLVALVGVSPADAYVVDVFRVRGGRHHLWAAHGSAYEDQQVETSVELAPREGTLLGPGTRYSAERDPELDSESFKGAIFGLIDRLSAGATASPWSATWRFAEKPEVGLKLTMLGTAPRKIILGQAPSILRAKEDNLKVDEPKMPLLLVEAEEGESTFVAVWEPFSGRPFITGIRALPAAGKSSRPLSLEVAIGDRTDRIDIDPDGSARFTLVSKIPGRRQLMHISGRDIQQGRIAGLYREGDVHGFEVEGRLPRGADLTGKLLLVHHLDGRTQPFTIAGVKESAGRPVLIVAGELGLAAEPEAGAYRQLNFPHAVLKSGLGTYTVQDSLCTLKSRVSAKSGILENEK